MPYFFVDDQITFHPKAVAAGNAAMGAWTRAGAWAKNHATGGFVPVEIAHAIGVRESKRLLAVGLWEPAQHDEYGAGYSFHDWQHVAGNFDGTTEKERRDAKREADRERQRRKRDRDRDDDVSHAVTSPRISSPSVPSPSPDDMTNSGPVPSEIPARDGWTDEEIKSSCKSARIHDLDHVITTVQRVTGPIAHVSMLFDLIAGIDRIARRAGGPIKNADAYLDTACLNSPEEIEREWQVVRADWDAAVGASKAVAS